MSKGQTTFALLFFLAGSALAQGDKAAIQGQIQAMYDRACLALHYKYVDGVMGIRARPCRIMTTDGTVLDEATEMRALENLFAQATTLSETTTITDLVVLDDHTVRTRVRDVLELHHPVQGGQPQPALVIRSLSDDTWVKVGAHWKLKTSEAREGSTDSQ
ncbi:MAG TPA: hypothetical protein VGO93_08870 [Candidatus Xenobia bacterium]|jgi:hypothetical protein